MRRPARRHLLFASAALVGALVDQVAKALVAARFPEDAVEAAPVIPGLVGILRHRNYGALWGLGDDYPTLLILISFAAMGLIVWLFVSAKPHRRLTDLALALMMAGAVGNLIDRLLLGYVSDFIKLLFVKYPVFNLADVWLTVGVGLMLVGLAFGRKPQPLSKSESAA